MKIFLDRTNYKELPELTQRSIKNGGLDIEIESHKDVSDASFKKIMPFVYQALDQEKEAGIWLFNFPYCVLNNNSRDHNYKRGAGRGEKTSSCKKCSYFNICPGFPAGYFIRHGKKEICPILDLPIEVMLEVEPRCNFQCAFCFNQHSFAKNGRALPELKTVYWKKVIAGIARAGIKIIRFTGGEPLLRSDIYELMGYAKKKGLEVRLNTNGSLINKKNAKRIASLIDNVLISIESYEGVEEERINGFPGALEKKKEAIRLLKAAGLSRVRVGTVIRKKIIKDFDKMAKMIMSLPIDEWEFYRPVPGGRSKEKLVSKDIELLARVILALRQKTDKIVSIANSIPFCFIKDRNLMNAACTGAQFDEGHSRLVVDPRGFVKPHYFIDVDLGDPLDLMRAWKSPFLKKIRQFMPKKCKQCAFRQKCLGGSRFNAYLGTKNWLSCDPWGP